MNAIVRQFTICVLLLAGFIQPSPAQGQNNRKHHEPGIIGFVDGGRTWEIAVETSTGDPVTFLETDEDGFFMVVLQPGEYVLTPYYIPQPGPGGVTPNYIIMGPATTVKVKRNHFTFVVLPTTLGHARYFQSPEADLITGAEPVSGANRCSALQFRTSLVSLS